MSIFISLIILLTSLLCLWAAAQDYMKMEIPNRIVAVLAGLFIPAAFIVMLITGFSDFLDWVIPHLASALIVFGVTALIYTFGTFGAGDSKFATAAALWFPLGDLMAFAFYTALLGGLLGIFTIFLKKKNILPANNSKWLQEIYSGKSIVPYGIAIALGTIFAFVHLGYYAPSATAFLAQ
ncbi:MAG: hypothetical protein GC136_04260 [Alphaproteobacteria bacterium]|nr:hypothetical protein [Alphaproteobacteria bacterium]